MYVTLWPVIEARKHINKLGGARIKYVAYVVRGDITYVRALCAC